MSSTHSAKPSWLTAARVLAILALLLAGAAIVAVMVLGGEGGKSGSAGIPSPTRSSDSPKDPYYVVKAGDNFSTIAAKEGVGQALIRRLNPSLDPLGIQPDNCVDLVPHGCSRLAPGTPSRARSTPAPKDPYYVVRAGDSFSTIAAKEGVDLALMRRRNPNVHPLGLQPGDCVDLAPSGCRLASPRPTTPRRLP